MSYFEVRLAEALTPIVGIAKKDNSVLLNQQLGGKEQSLIALRPCLPAIYIMGEMKHKITVTCINQDIIGVLFDPFKGTYDWR